MSVKLWQSAWRSESGEWLVEDQKLGAVEHGDYKLHLLRHTLGELLHLLPPPVHDSEALKPYLELGHGLTGSEALQFCEE